jgi:hypothetical protein
MLFILFIYILFTYFIYIYYLYIYSLFSIPMVPFCRSWFLFSPRLCGLLGKHTLDCSPGTGTFTVGLLMPPPKDIVGTDVGAEAGVGAGTKGWGWG